MKISRSSWLVRWAYLDFWPFSLVELSQPNRVSVCKFFWQATLLAPMVAIAITGFFIMAFVPGTTIYYLLRFFLVSPAKFLVRYLRRKGAPEPFSLVKAYIKAKKDKVCPIIELTDDWTR